MSDQLSMFPQTTSEDTASAISSPELRAGLSPSGSRDGRTKKSAGPDHVPVSRFRTLDSGKAMPTNATSGPLFTASSPSADLQSFLENRLHQRMGVNGSPLYALTWKTVDMPSGPPISALRASARRISDSGCILPLKGWMTPRARGDAGGNRWENGNIRNLEDEAQLAGWPTAAARDWKNGKSNLHEKNARPLNEVAMLAGWPTPRQTDGEKNVRTMEGALSEIARKGSPQDLCQAVIVAGWPTPTSKEAAGGEYKDPEKALARVLGPHSNDLRDFAKIACPTRLTASGEILTGSTAGMESGGQLNPRFSGYLQGYQKEWCEAALNAALHIRLQKERSKQERKG